MNSGIYEPPEEVSDATTVVKAAVGSLPYVGRMGEELLDQVLAAPKRARQQKWRKNIGDAVGELVDAGYLEPSKLADNEEFVTVIQAMSLSAIKTHNEAKIELLRNAALNVALRPDIYSAELDVLTTLVDDLTVWHVKLLRILANPEQSPVDHPSWHQERAGVLHSVSLLEVLQAAYPELKQDFPFLQRIYSDLVRYGLASERDFNKGWYIRDSPLPGDNSNNFCTGWGEKFLKFVADYRTQRGG